MDDERWAQVFCCDLWRRNVRRSPGLKLPKLFVHFVFFSSEIIIAEKEMLMTLIVVRPSVRHDSKSVSAAACLRCAPVFLIAPNEKFHFQTGVLLIATISFSALLTPGMTNTTTFS